MWLHILPTESFEGLISRVWPNVYLFLLFRLSLSPCTFSMVVEAALAPVRCQGIRLLAYLDDWLVIQVELHPATLVSHIQSQFKVNHNKSSLPISGSRSGLGSESCALFPTEEGCIPALSGTVPL